MKPLKEKWRKLAPLYLLLLVGAVAAMWMLKQCSANRSEVDKAYASSGADTIDVAIEYSPMSVYTYGDTLGGFNYDLLSAMAKEAGMPLRFHFIVSIEQALNGLNDSIFDIVVADIPMTLDFQERFNFTEPVFLDKQVLVQRRDSAGNVEVNSVLDMAQKHVWVEGNSPAEGRLRNLAAEIGDTIFVDREETYGAEQLFILTAIGELPRCVVNEKVAKKLASQYPDADISTAVSFTQFQSWMLRKNDTQLTDSINSMLLRFKATPAYDALKSRYF